MSSCPIQIQRSVKEKTDIISLTYIHAILEYDYDNTFSNMLYCIVYFHISNVYFRMLSTAVCSKNQCELSLHKKR